MDFNLTTEHLGHVERLVSVHGIHTVEIAIADTYGHLRGKRVPVDRFVNSVATGGINIADAIYVFDPLCEIVDAPTINMNTGYLDMHLVPDLATFRVLAHRPGYAIVFCDAMQEDGTPHPLDPRQVLKAQARHVESAGYQAVVATELECYLFTSDWQPFQNHVQYSSLTDALDVEEMVNDMRAGILAAGIPLESSNPEYGPGQLEINFGPADAVTTADNTVLFKSIVKQVAVQHGARASFMSKPYATQSGSGMHIHTSLNVGRDNVFGAATNNSALPNQVMSDWTAGLLHHARAMQLVGIPTPNGYRRVMANTFCPTHVHWGADNRTVMARLTLHAGSANRVEFRCAGADANPYLAIAAVLAAGRDGLEKQRTLEPISKGDLYANPGSSPALPTSIEEAIAAFSGSEIAGLLGDAFATNFLTMCNNEQALAKRPMSVASAGDEVTEWEFIRYREHT
jgi:glutamine synthetase